jgi:hypothetical protein
MDMFEIDHDHCGPSLKSRVRFAPLVLKDDILDDRGSPGRVTPCGISLKIKENQSAIQYGPRAAALECTASPAPQRTAISFGKSMTVYEERLELLHAA